MDIVFVTLHGLIFVKEGAFVFILKCFIESTSEAEIQTHLTYKYCFKSNKTIC